MRAIRQPDQSWSSHWPAWRLPFSSGTPRLCDRQLGGAAPPSTPIKTHVGLGHVSEREGFECDGSDFLVTNRACASFISVPAGLDIEQMPGPEDELWPPVHTFLLAEAGIPMIEVVDLQALAEDRTYEFAFIGAALKLRGASGAPIRPLAIPLASD